MGIVEGEEEKEAEIALLVRKIKSRMMVSRFRGTLLLLLTLLAEVSKTVVVVVCNRMNLGRVVGTPFQREALAGLLSDDYVLLRFFFSSQICNKFSFFNFFFCEITEVSSDYSASS